MQAAGLFVAAADDRVGGVQKKDVVVHLFLVERLQRAFGRRARAQAADVHDDGHTLELVFTLQRKIDQAGQQPRRDIVDAEKADVLQGVGRHRFARAGQTGNDKKVHGQSSSQNAFQPTTRISRSSV